MERTITPMALGVH